MSELRALLESLGFKVHLIQYDFERMVFTLYIDGVPPKEALIEFCETLDAEVRSIRVVVDGFCVVASHHVAGVWTDTIRGERSTVPREFVASPRR